MTMVVVTTTTSSSRALFCGNYASRSFKPLAAKSSLSLPQLRRSRSCFCEKPLVPKENDVKSRTLSSCYASRRKPAVLSTSSAEEGDDNNNNTRRVLQIALWVAEGIYIFWLFLLPFAPGDPVWAISSDTINSLVGLSLNFFFILPFINFAFLIPYMAIRLNDADDDSIQSERSQFGSAMTNGAPLVGLIGGAVCLLSLWWALYGRLNANFGGIGERWEFLVNYLGSERFAYAFIWDICLYVIFQPWLIGENLQNVQESKVVLVKYLRYVPVVGLIAYLLCLDRDVV